MVACCTGFHLGYASQYKAVLRVCFHFLDIFESRRFQFSLQETWDGIRWLWVEGVKCRTEMMKIDATIYSESRGRKSVRVYVREE